MSLQQYRDKRDFVKTPEPRGKKTRGSVSTLHFVVQKHAARRLHYDFRLELDGTLKSWAIPKGPSLDPADKRLAVHVEDHPLEYGEFEGVIPEKQYGAGPVALWDRGTWEPEGDPRRDYREGHLKFRLKGSKLRGGWALVRMKGRGAPGKEPWLLIKERDDAARPGHGAELIEEHPESVKTHRTIEDIAAGRKKPATRAVPASRPARATPAAPATGAPVAKLPAKFTPELATLVDTPPQGEDWLYEIKYDGYRILARIENGNARLITRNGQDWTSKFPQIARDLTRLKLNSAWLDGEICVIGEGGRTSFSALQRALSGESSDIPVYVVFDVPYLDGRDLRSVALRDRQQALQRVIGKPGARSTLRLSQPVAGSGATVREQACKHGFEGVIGKRAGSPYRGDRTRDWIKLKCRQGQEFVIGGYSPPEGSRQGFGALLLGVHEKNGDLRYAGRVGTGFNDKVLRSLQQRMRKLVVDKPPFRNPPKGRLARDVRWVRPELVAQITFAEWTHDGLVRQASFEGLREDKPEADVGRERPQPSARTAAASNSRRKTAARDSVVAGIAITHPDRLLYPEAKITKLRVAQYYERIAPRMLPYVERRPLAIVRCPEGPGGPCFFQKHATKGQIPGIETAMIVESGGRHPYIVANTLEALVGLAQMNALELHVWGATVSALERPDTMVFDLDPDPALDWSKVVDAALLTRALLKELGLESLVKTTGGKGLHVVVPLSPRHSWREVKSFAQAVANHLAQTLPQQFTATVTKTHRRGRIFVDYLRNDRGSLAVAPYSLRARPGATVATPLAWEELNAKVRPSAFNLESVLERIERDKDPWADYEKLRQRLTAPMRRSLKAQ